MFARILRWFVVLVILLSLVPPAAICQDLKSKGKPETLKEKFARTKVMAESGDARAQYELGIMYGVRDRFRSGRNFNEAMRWYRKAADQGYAPAQSLLGNIYDHGFAVPQDKTEAVRWYRKAFEYWNRKALEKNDTDAQNKLGEMYLGGWGVPRDFVEAVKWFRKSADQGHAPAQCNLAMMYNNGWGVPEDRAKALKWYRLSANQGFLEAQKRLSTIYFIGIPGVVAENKAEAEKWNRLSAESDLDEACNLAGMYESGAFGRKDEVEAARWLRKAAEQEFPRAQNNLGVMYKEGQGVPQSDAEAVKWFRLAADQEYGLGQLNLGKMYKEGRGVPQNDAEAERWIRLATDRGNEYARAEMAEYLPEINLFGIRLKDALRADLRASIRKHGATIKSEDDNKWGDSYASGAILDGSSDLTVEYTYDNRFAIATYTFPGFMNKELIVKVREMVESKYGAPGESSGDPELGPVSYRWDLKDGIRIIVSRGWPNTTTYLEYVDPKNHKTMKAEMEAQQKQKEAKKYQAQDKVF